MAYSHYERLSALDATFLEVEDHRAHMHVGAVALFESAPLTNADGATDMERIRRMIEVSLHRVPRYQQKLAYVPFFGNPVWVDDERFNLNYHVRHVRLPVPGDERQLKRLAGRIMSQQLDRGKPLWEMWLIDGVEGNRVAIITKAHHCMMDGVGSVELTASMVRATPDLERRLSDPPRWIPRPAPAPQELLRDELARRAAEPFAGLAALGRALIHPAVAWNGLVDGLLGIGEALQVGLRPASPTPLNIDIGPHRRFDWLDMDLDAIKTIKNKLGGTINDVILTIVAGALGRFLHGRGLFVEDLDFRAMIPVNLRTEAQRERLGNQITMLVAPLPIAERDPQRRLQEISKGINELKASRQGAGVRTLENVSDSTATTLFTVFARLSTASRPYNIVVTNVPGPQFQAFFVGSPMLTVYPLVPLNRNQALGIALFSYNNGLYWGFNADWDAVPDLHDLVEAVKLEFETLRSVAANATSPILSERKPVRRKSKRSRAARAHG